MRITKHKIILRASIEKKALLKSILVGILLAPSIYLGLWVAKPVEKPISPLSIYYPPVKAKKVERASYEVWEGKASWYGTGEGECLGCNDERIMANGEKLDNDKLTVAFNRVELNEQVKVINKDNGSWVVAKVTDKGGFEKYGKIADLGKRVKQVLGCSDVCDIKIQHERVK